MKGLPLVFVCLVGSCFGQQTVGDKAFWGTWNMDVAKSKFAPGHVPPKSAQTVVNQNGYVATQQGGTGPPSLAVALVRGECYLIGPFPPVVSCIVNTENPLRPIISFKEGDKVTRKSEVELVGETTLTVKTTIQTPTGWTVLSEAVYTKAAPTPAPAKK